MKTIYKIHRYIDLHKNEDYTFKFYSNGGLSIMDNNTGEYLLPGDLSKEAYAFYALKRIEYIKDKLLSKSNNKSA